MIYIHPIGGLGNMLFHIASIWTLANDSHDTLCLINIDKKISDLMNYHARDGSKYKYLFERFPIKNSVKYYSEVYPFHYVPLIYVKEYEYIGYFQTEKYFKHRRNEILNLFKPSDEIVNKLNEYSHLFNNASLHVRRGDYINSKINIPQTIDYYEKAITYIPNDMKILIFSDDLEWCKSHFFGERFVFINEPDYIAIYLMSKMKHNIIANSSFSWWGAWMSTNDNKIIIAPKKWFGENTVYDGDLIPENWLRI